MEHTRILQPLQIGDHVYVQNLVGNHPLKWERTGTIIETRQYHQYVVRIDGSGRVTLRNRQHLRRFTPFHKPQDVRIRELSSPPPPPPLTSVDDSYPTCTPTEPILERPYYDREDTSPEVLPQAQPAHAEQRSDGASTEPVVTARKPAQPLPKALARLLPHNMPGRSELQPLEPRRRHIRNNSDNYLHIDVYYQNS